MTDSVVRHAGDFLIDVGKRLNLGCDSSVVRRVLERACGGELPTLGPDGRRASGLTRPGIPFEVSVTGGRGRYEPAFRYVTESGTNSARFSSRLADQRAAIRELLAGFPGGVEAEGDMFDWFITSLYPESANIPASRSFGTWTGVAHHAAVPRSPARLKVYGGLFDGSRALERLRHGRPEFDGLSVIPEGERLIRASLAAVEIDVDGAVKHKVYLRAKRGDVAVPLKLIRYFGDPAWEALSELVRCGLDPARFYEHDVLICRARDAGTTTTFALNMLAHRHDDLGDLVRELAVRHHGSTEAVDALTDAANSCGASLYFSAICLGFSAEHGIDKLNVYATPTWDVEERTLPQIA
ncbi:hypothetical protein ACGF5S_07145 [Nocardia nova]|uniref:hypothetical protein n=1 Tax=Nocardia nova TaxID=37330 RepID=UPI00371614A8